MAVPLVALITGGSAGLGAAAARLFAKNSMRVVVNYNNNAERAQSLIEELYTVSPLARDDQRPNFCAIKADVAKKADIQRLVEESVSSMGRLDVVFSNHGWTRLRDITNLDDNLDEEDWDTCFNMNVKSHLWLMKAAKKHLDQTEGAFITTASLAGVKVSGSSLAYSVSKAAQIHLAKGLAIAAAPHIRVNTVSPGLLLTEWGLRFPVEAQEDMKNRSKLKRISTVEDVAEQVLCFAKSKSVTGQNIVIDCGLSV